MKCTKSHNNLLKRLGFASLIYLIAIQASCAQPMQETLMQMLTRFSEYIVNDWQPCVAPNSIGEQCGFFKGENSGGSDERGVRPNADLSMVCAFLVKYAQPAGYVLPDGITYARLDTFARQSLIFAYSTHQSNHLKVCAGGSYWGSTSHKQHTWESSLWAMSVAYSAYFQWEKLSAVQRGYIYNLLRAECNYELERTIPTRFLGDTKAEENGWEADVLAATLALFPNDSLAPQWYERFQEFAFNSYSHPSDVGHPLYKGANLFPDFSLQNHNLFHTSYQNVVQQELGEAFLALKLFSSLHSQSTLQLPYYRCLPPEGNLFGGLHMQDVQDSILNWLALPDGELAMPNGNDWSLFLYDQLTSYATMSCLFRDADALMLEERALQQMQRRQATTSDGSWLLRPDVGARRMGVQAHRVMMTWLLHHVFPTDNLRPSSWEDFRQRHAAARLIPYQKVVRASAPHLFSCFSWSEGLQSYTGYFTPNDTLNNNLIVPFRAHNTGNIIGWYEVEGHHTNARPACEPRFVLQGAGYTVYGALHTNDSALTLRFSLQATEDNRLIYCDTVTANADVTITAVRGGLLAISTDPFTRTQRTFSYPVCCRTRHKTLDGTILTHFKTSRMNIDNTIQISTPHNRYEMAFGDCADNNSIHTSKFYAFYSNKSRKVHRGECIDTRTLIISNL